MTRYLNKKNSSLESKVQMSLGERNLIFSFKDFLMKIWVEGGIAADL